jgi:3-oxoacyl-[acyl-carrier protein] reductase
MRWAMDTSHRAALLRAPNGIDKLLEEGFIPFNRWGTPEDVGRAVATTAAGELAFTTGAALQVGGGMHIHQY